MSVVYFDTSALVKLVVPEAKTDALLAWTRRAAETSTAATSVLSRVELVRAVRGHAPTALPQAAAVLDGLRQVSIGPEVLAGAAAVGPDGLRSLDAVHLATALLVGEQLRAFVAYDTRLCEAATSAGLAVVSP